MATHEDDPDRLFELDLEFHIEICRATRNRILDRFMYSSRWWQSASRRLSNRAPRALPEATKHHRKIYEALAARDPRRAAAAMREHLMLNTLLLMADRGGGGVAHGSGFVPGHAFAFASRCFAQYPTCRLCDDFLPHWQVQPVDFGDVASAMDHPTLPAFSFISWTARAPRSGELTPGRLVSHWIASCAMDLPYFAAIGRKPLDPHRARARRCPAEKDRCAAQHPQGAAEDGKGGTLRRIEGGIPGHLKETEGQVSRLEKVFELLDITPKGKKCEAIEGILGEGAEIMKEFKGAPALDAGLVSAAQAVEHYEIARYGTLKRWAEQLGFNDAIRLLDATLSEEKNTDEALTELADTKINEQAEAAA